jgi:hypothetical protein
MFPAGGRSVDFDTPLALMDKPGSLLAKLVESTGAETAAELRRMWLARHRGVIPGPAKRPLHACPTQETSYNGKT